MCDYTFKTASSTIKLQGFDLDLTQKRGVRHARSTRGDELAQHCAAWLSKRYTALSFKTATLDVKLVMLATIVVLLYIVCVAS